MMVFDREMTIAEAKAVLLHSGLLERGQNCPCCGQFAKEYRRTIHATMAQNLIRAYRTYYQAAFRPIDLLGATSPDFVKLRFWGLLAEVDPDAVRPDTSPRTGAWAITDRGVAFVRNAVTVQKYAHVYDGRMLSLSGPQVAITECLGRRFNYAELMGGV